MLVLFSNCEALNKYQKSFFCQEVTDTIYQVIYVEYIFVPHGGEITDFWY